MGLFVTTEAKEIKEYKKEKAQEGSNQLSHRFALLFITKLMMWPNRRCENTQEGKFWTR